MSEEEAKKVPTWEQRDFTLASNLTKICEATIEATKIEIKNLKRKLDKLQYGSK